MTSSQNPAPKILIVEDSADLLELWRAAFRHLAAETVFVDCATDALAAVENGFKPNLLMTDHQLVGMSGIELLAQLRKQYPALCCLMISGTPEEELRMLLPKDVKVLRKPVSLSTLKTAVQSELATC